MKILLPIVFFTVVGNISLPYFSNPPVKREIKLIATRIIDGDTFEGRANDSTFRIRLNGIDAPERGQEFYAVSKQRLGELCRDSPLKVLLYNKDRYGRWIADVYNQDNIHVNYKLVEEGLAWHFKKYSGDNVLALLEDSARVRKAGLWISKETVAPWIKRK